MGVVGIVKKMPGRYVVEWVCPACGDKSRETVEADETTAVTCEACGNEDAVHVD